MKTHSFVFTCIFILLVFLAACVNPASPSGTPPTPVTVEPNPAVQQPGQPDAALAAAAQAAIQAIRDKDFTSLADMAASQGVRFSPYAYIRAEDLVFTPEQMRTIFNDTRQYTWGAYDGTGEPITLNFADYYARFIYDVDFSRPKTIGYNTIVGRGNSLNNLVEFYPGADFVEFHFPGFEPQYEGMDWRSLRLVFQRIDQAYKLVGIVHDQWTI